MTKRADTLSALLDHAFGELLWISEAPNRDENPDQMTLELANRARMACAHIERLDPDKKAAPR